MKEKSKDPFHLPKYNRLGWRGMIYPIFQKMRDKGWQIVFPHESKAFLFTHKEHGVHPPTRAIYFFIVGKPPTPKQNSEDLFDALFDNEECIRFDDFYALDVIAREERHDTKSERKTILEGFKH